MTTKVFEVIVTFTNADEGVFAIINSADKVFYKHDFHIVGIPLGLCPQVGYVP